MMASHTNVSAPIITTTRKYLKSLIVTSCVWCPSCVASTRPASYSKCHRRYFQSHENISAKQNGWTFHTQKSARKQEKQKDEKRNRLKPAGPDALFIIAGRAARHSSCILKRKYGPCLCMYTSILKDGVGGEGEDPGPEGSSRLCLYI